MHRLTRDVLLFAAVLAGWSAAAPSASAQTNGGIVDGRHTEPSPSQVLPRERQAGVAPSKGQADQNQSTVDQLGKELLDKEQTDPPTKGSVPPVQAR